MNMTAQERRRAEDGAKRYAAANQSDPFAYSRAMSHLNNGVASMKKAEDGSREPAYYDAKQGVEKRSLPPGQQFSDGSRQYEVVSFNDQKVP